VTESVREKGRTREGGLRQVFCNNFDIKHILLKNFIIFIIKLTLMMMMMMLLMMMLNKQKTQSIENGI